MLTLLLDLDGVCCNFEYAFRAWYYTESGVWLPPTRSHDEYDKLIKQYLKVTGIFQDIPLLDGCYSTLQKHKNNYEYVIVTARIAKHHDDTRKWVYKNIPNVSGIIFTSSNNKWRVRGDIIIDDSPVVLSSFEGLPTITIKMSYTYNQLAPSHIDVCNWADIDIILDRITHGHRLPSQ